MDALTQELYGPMLERDLEEIPSACAQFSAERGDQALIEAVTRFAALGFSPSQHGRHALYACIEALDAAPLTAARHHDLIVECAIYAAESRPPWSEPPVMAAPASGQSGEPAASELRRAISSGDRLAGERALGRLIDEGTWESVLLEIASGHLDDLGHRFTTTVAAIRLARRNPPTAAFPIARVALLDLVATREPERQLTAEEDEPLEVLRQVVESASDDESSIEMFHVLEMLDAAMIAAELIGDHAVARRVAGHIANEIDGIGNGGGGSEQPPVMLPPPIYSLGRDFGQYLIATSIRRRLMSRFPSVDLMPLLTAAAGQLEANDSFEHWSFA